MNRITIDETLKRQQQKSFQEVLWVNLAFALTSLLINEYLGRDVFVLVHCITAIALFGFILLQNRFSQKLMVNTYLGFIAVIFLSYLWIGENEYKDSIWVLFFPMMVAFLLNKEKLVIRWLVFINLALISSALLSPLWDTFTDLELTSLFSLSFALFFMSILTWHNVRYKGSYWQLKTDFENELELQVNDALKTIRALNDELEVTQRDIVVRLGEVCEMRSEETGQHVLRVSEYSALLAQLARLTETDIELIKDASPLHDAGKVGIPDSILNKPGRLTAEEYEIMKTHTLIGHQILNTSERPLLKVAAEIALSHHEHWNGKGYPHGLKGEKISLKGRIVAIADVFDALSFARVYKPAWSDDKIFKHFEAQLGEQFDPELCQLFLLNFSKFVALRNQFI